MDKKIKDDRDLLLSIGTCAEVARLLGRSTQCVFNWSKRGIPAKVKLEFPDLFLKKPSDKPDS